MLGLICPISGKVIEKDDACVINHEQFFKGRIYSKKALIQVLLEESLDLEANRSAGSGHTVLYRYFGSLVRLQTALVNVENIRQLYDPAATRPIDAPPAKTDEPEPVF